MVGWYMWIESQLLEAGRSKRRKVGKEHWRYICSRGTDKNNCKECGGSSICEHRQRRSRCKECGGVGICEHGRQRNVCKECEGSSICEHRQRRSRCKECGGSSVCEHGREHRRCNECGGASMCEHSRERHRCKECSGASLCTHGRQPSRCKECGGASICEHGRERRRIDVLQLMGHNSAVRLITRTTSMMLKCTRRVDIFRPNPVWECYVYAASRKPNLVYVSSRNRSGRWITCGSTVMG